MAKSIILSVSILFIVFSSGVLIGDDCIQALRLVRKTTIPTLSRDEVTSNLDNAIKLCPKLVEAYYEYGRFYLNHKEYGEAESMFKKADALSPKLEFILGLAYSQWGKKDFLSCENTYKEAIGRYSGDWRLLEGLAVLYISVNRYKEAEDLLRQALQEESSVGSIYFNLGMSLLKLRREDEAITSFNTALLKDPKISQASLALSELYMKRDQLSKARAILEPAILHDPENFQLLEMMFSVLEASGETSDANRLVERMSDKLGDEKKKVFLALVKIKEGDVDPGLEVLKGMVESGSSLQIAYGVYGWALASVNKLESAEKVLNRAIELDPEDGFSVNNLGVVYEKQGLRNKAKEQFEKASIMLPYAKSVEENVERLQ